MGHFKIICKICGKTISQCRCMKCDKTVTYETCGKCLDRAQSGEKELFVHDFVEEGMKVNWKEARQLKERIDHIVDDNKKGNSIYKDDSGESGNHKKVDELAKAIVRVIGKSFGLPYAYDKKSSEKISKRMVKLISPLLASRPMAVDDVTFINHIQGHLKDGEEVICKICGKTAKEITEKEYLKPQQTIDIRGLAKHLSIIKFTITSDSVDKKAIYELEIDRYISQHIEPCKKCEEFMPINACSVCIHEKDETISQLQSQLEKAELIISGKTMYCESCETARTETERFKKLYTKVRHKLGKLHSKYNKLKEK